MAFIKCVSGFGYHPTFRGYNPILKPSNTTGSLFFLIPEDPWDWYIYLHETIKSTIPLCKYTIVPWIRPGNDRWKNRRFSSWQLPGQDEGTFGQVERWRGSHQGHSFAQVPFSMDGSLCFGVSNQTKTKQKQNKNKNKNKNKTKQKQKQKQNKKKNKQNKTKTKTKTKTKQKQKQHQNKTKTKQTKLNQNKNKNKTKTKTKQKQKQHQNKTKTKQNKNKNKTNQTKPKQKQKQNKNKNKTKTKTTQNKPN